MENLPHILLAEDSSNDIELLLSIFEDNSLGNEIDVVRDGVDLMDFLKYRGRHEHREKYQPVVILLDIKMPRMNGIEVLKEIKNDPELKSIPVVMLTSSNLDKDIMDSYNMGVNAYVIKPVNFAEFVTAMKNIGVFWGILNKTPGKLM